MSNSTSSTHLRNRKDAATSLGVAEQTPAPWTSTGRYGLPTVKIGHCMMYRQIGLGDLIERNTAAGGVVQ
jgi:hypothetical protein